MPDVKLPDGTVLRFPDGMSQDAMRGAIDTYLGKKEKPSAAMDAAKSIGSGLATGVAGMADLPGKAVNWLGGKAFDVLGAAGLPEDYVSAGKQSIAFGPMGSGQTAASTMEAAVPGATTYDPQTTAGEYLQTVGEFLPGAVMGPGGVARNVGQMVGAGLTSEAFGQAVEGSKLEPVARVVGGVLGGGVTGAATAPKVARVAGVSDDIAAAADTLRRYGINPTVGQTTGREGLMRAEGTMTATGRQIGDLTEAVLGTAGIKARAATPGVLATGRNQITNGMNDILKNVDVPITTQIGPRIAQAADDYFTTTAGGVPMPALRRISDELLDAATNPQGATIPATKLREWRTILGSKTTSKDEAVRDAAHALREIIDDATEAALQQLGRADDVAKLQGFRDQYRNFLAIVDATTKGGREAARGIITPERISTATKRVMGKTPYATGGGTSLSELARSAEMVLGSLPTVSAGGVRSLPVSAVLGTTGAGAGLAASSPGLAAGLAAGGFLAPKIGSAALRSRMLQSMLADPRSIASQQLPVLPGLLSSE